LIASAIPDRAWTTRGDFSFSQIATGDLNITFVGQLPPPNLPLGDEFEPGPMKVVGLDAAFRCGSLTNQDLENARGKRGPRPHIPTW
jgi:hypothetical protein